MTAVIRRTARRCLSLINWNFGDPNASPPGNPNTSNQQNPTHRYTAAANYNMSLDGHQQ